MSEMDDSPNIQYSVKELLAIQAKALERIERKVEEGAVQQAVAIAKLDVRLTSAEGLIVALDPRVRILEDAQSEGRGERGYRRFLWPLAAAIVGSSWWLPNLFHHHS